MTEVSDTLRDRRIVVVTSRLWQGYNDLWDAVEPDVAALAVVGAHPSGARAETQAPRSHVALRSVDLSRGLVWEHLVGLRRFLRTFRPDLVHVNRELWALTSQELLSSDAAVVVHGAENLWQHGPRAEQALRRRLVERAVRNIAGYASWNHAGSDHVRDLRDRLGLPPVPTLVSPAIVPPAEFRAARWKPVSEVATLDLLLVGRATPAKGFQHVIDAVAGLPTRITVCGEGPMLEELIRQARSRAVDLRALGFVSGAELAGLMARSHLMVQPSLTTSDWAEQFGRSVAEAMTVGLPSLVSDSGELPYLVGHDERAVFGEGDVPELRQRLVALTEPDRLNALSRHQRSLSTTWQAATTGAAVLDLWRRVLA